MKIALVAAVARSGVIGRDGGIPWRIAEDMRHFREVTMGYPVVMGRRTWDSIPERFRPLPGRRNVVVTRNPEWSGIGAERARSLDDALGLLDGAEQVFVIGGAELYAAALPRADELLLTEIDDAFEGDTFFPSWDRRTFAEKAREATKTASGIAISFVTYVRRPTASGSEKP